MTEAVVWGRGSSSNVQKVLWAVFELDLKIERRIVGGEFGGLDTVEFKRLNPNSTIPVWQVGSFALWESQAILRHLGRIHHRLYGSSEAQRSQIDCWLDWSAVVYWPDIRFLFHEIYRAGVTHERDTAATAAIARIKKRLLLLNEHLSREQYLAGDFSVADIAHGISVNRTLGFGYGITLPEHVDAWFNRISARPTFARATSDEFDMPGHHKEH